MKEKIKNLKKIMAVSDATEVRIHGNGAVSVYQYAWKTKYTCVAEAVAMNEDLEGAEGLD